MESHEFFYFEAFGGEQRYNFLLTRLCMLVGICVSIWIGCVAKMSAGAGLEDVLENEKISAAERTARKRAAVEAELARSGWLQVLSLGVAVLVTLALVLGSGNWESGLGKMEKKRRLEQEDASEGEDEEEYEEKFFRNIDQGADLSGTLGETVDIHGFEGEHSSQFPAGPSSSGAGGKILPKSSKFSVDTWKRRASWYGTPTRMREVLNKIEEAGAFIPLMQVLIVFVLLLGHRGCPPIPLLPEFLLSPLLIVLVAFTVLFTNKRWLKRKFFEINRAAADLPLFFRSILHSSKHFLAELIGKILSLPNLTRRLLLGLYYLLKNFTLYILRFVTELGQDAKNVRVNPGAMVESCKQGQITDATRHVSLKPRQIDHFIEDPLLGKYRIFKLSPSGPRVLPLLSCL